jgi:transposase-like protein
MPASVALHANARPRDRSIEARRAARAAKFERERLIVDSLNRGVAVAEIAERIGVTEKRLRALIKEILARRAPAAPEDYAALQASRLNEALLVAYGAMSPENLKAVALVVRIVRELDRYHGFAAAGRRNPRQAGVEAEEPAPAGDGRKAALQEPASERTQASALTPADDVVAPAASPCIGAEKAPQALEKMENVPENGAGPGGARSSAEGPFERSIDGQDGVVGAPNEASPPAAAPQPDPACAASCARAEMAPQPIGTIESAPGNGWNSGAAARERSVVPVVQAAKPGGLVRISARRFLSALTRIPNFLIHAPPHHLMRWTEPPFALAESSGAMVESVATVPWGTGSVIERVSRMARRSSARFDAGDWGAADFDRAEGVRQ